MQSRTLPQATPVVSKGSWIDSVASPPDPNATPSTGATPVAPPEHDLVRPEIDEVDPAARQSMRSAGAKADVGTHGGRTPPAHAPTRPGAGSRSRPELMEFPATDLALFLKRVRELLDATEEPQRRQLESEVLDLAIPLQAAGMFEILNIAHPALATMVSDHLAEFAAM